MKPKARWLILGLTLTGCGDNIHPADETPARIDTTITPDPVTAGETATATCTVYNAAGDVLEGHHPYLGISPKQSGTTITGLSAVLTHAGQYTGQCILPGVAGNNAPFEVVHALPATLAIGKSPDQTVYAIDAEITITHAVTDRFGNPIDDAVVTTTSAPVTGVGPTSVLSAASFSYGGEGKYRITAAVTPPTDGDVPVTASIDVVVNQSGPRITCGVPADGAMLNVAAGSAVTVGGTAIDVNGTMDVNVAGNSVAVASDGSFSAQVTAQFGINFVEIVATDAFGVATTKVCTFLAASQWANPSSIYGDTVALDLAQGAIDDGARNGPIGSLADILYAVENSTGIRTTLDSALLAANPLKASSCDSQTCTFLGCICWYSSAITYLSSVIDGPNTDGLTLITNGVATQAQVNGLHLDLHVWGKVAGIPYDTTGNVNISYVQILLTLDPALSAGRPRVTVRPGTVVANVGSITTSFGGLDGWIINNIVVPLAQGSLRTTVKNQISSFITNNFNSVLDGVMSGLDISSLGTSFNVPRIDGSGSVALGFGVGASSLSTTSSRMLFGLGTRFTGATANSYTTLGVPIPAGAVLATPTFGGSNTAVAAHVAIFNQALHALWKANYFSATIDGSGLSPSAPPGLVLTIAARLPPVASFDTANNVALALGDIDISLVAPSLPPNLTVTLGARAHTAMALNGNDLQFSGIVVDEVHISSDVIDWSAMDQAMVQDLLKTVAQQLADQSLNNALPALPIPAFPIPASLTPFGIPLGNLGLGSPSLAVTQPHFVLRGNFGIH